jgi:flagellar motor switch protein FliM
MSEILTPEEIAALTAAFAADAPLAEPPPSGAVRTIDLANQERSLEGRLPGLDLVLARFGRGVRDVLAGCFGDVPNVRTASVGLVRFARLAPLLVEPAALVRFRLLPLRGQGILTIPPPLLAAMLQAACGGPVGSAPALPLREFSPVELALIERFASRVLGELHAAWQPIAALDCARSRSIDDAASRRRRVARELVVHASRRRAGARADCARPTCRTGR